MFPIPDTIKNEKQLDEFLSLPYPETIEMMKRLQGDIMILGAGGKMGPSLAAAAVRACREAGIAKRIIAVDLFPEQGAMGKIKDTGAEAIACDLLDPAQVDSLPRAENVIFMAGRKFGAVGSETLTWMINVIVPENVCRVFSKSRIVAFSTGCVYALVPPDSGGSVETDFPMPVGEYANSCLGRERVFEYFAERYKTPVLLFRLNYAVELRYGVLADIARKVWAGEPVERSVGAVNFIWQGDAVNRALLCLELASAPAVPLNVTGAETLRLEDIAQKFGEFFVKPVRFCGADSGKAYLSNAARSIELFGAPRVTSDAIMRWTADWIQQGGVLYDKPTHYQVTDGQFLDSNKEGKK